jgi:ribose/xylose/arabinose/galactoside ABC-type transport system permease subunit
MADPTTRVEVEGRPSSAAAAGDDWRARARRMRDRVRGDGWGDVLFVPTVLAALVVYLSVKNEFFLDSINITNVFISGAILAIVAFGLTFVILCGELDLSVGAGVALVSVVTATVMRDTGSIPLGILAGVGLGIGIGLINGLIVTVLEVPSFIATLGMLTIANGVALAMTDGAVVSGVPQSLGNLIDDGFLGIRWVLWLVIGVFAALYFVQSQTSFGVRVFAVGGNREASRLSAIPVNRVRLLCFIIAGTTVGIAGVVLTARVQSGQPNAGGLLGLTAIAAIVVGGTNLLGGRGSVTRTLWGVLLIAVLQNGLELEGVNDDLRQVIIGAVFIAAASVEFFRRQLRRRARRKVTIDEQAPGTSAPPPAAPRPQAGTS